MDLSRMTAEQVIDSLDMEYLEGEGCWISLLWRSGFANAIYVLITPTDFSAMHRLKEDEAWTYIAGAPAHTLVLAPDGSHEAITLGTDLGDGHLPHFRIPGGHWQGTLTGGEWTLASCVLAPPFTEFELATADTDLSAWVAATEQIAARMRENA